MREPYQVLILPFRRIPKIEFYVFHRVNGYFQFISGGGETGEQLIETVQREFFEETGILLSNSFIRLETLNSIPVDAFHHKNNLNFEGFFVIPEYAFAVELNQEKITLSSEHDFFCCYRN